MHTPQCIDELEQTYSKLVVSPACARGGPVPLDVLPPGQLVCSMVSADIGEIWALIGCVMCYGTYALLATSLGMHNAVDVPG
jgi:hypothetical protein